MGCRKVSSVIMVVAVLAVVMAATTTEAQPIPSCATKLVPCAGFMNHTTKPPQTCCGPLSEAVIKELPCLCNLFKDPVSLMKNFNINVTQAMNLPHLCGLAGDLSSCKGMPPPGPPPKQPKATPTSANDHNGVARAAGTAISSLLMMAAALLMLW